MTLTEFFKPKATVADVHHEFMTASDRILLEANAVLAQSVANDEDQINKLALLGFTNVATVRTHREFVQSRKQAEEVAERVRYYRERYPNQKFITEEQVRVICKSYGLVHGTPKDFIGDMPRINRQEVLAFTCRDEDRQYHDEGIWGERYPRTYQEYAEQQEGIRLGIYPQRTGIEQRGLTIVASTSEFNMKDKKIDSKFRLVDKDPIVLCPVVGGYLVVTAWGVESEAVK